MRFDRQGNIYFIDKSDNLIQYSSKAKLVSGVKDAAITGTG
jgi:hypothetical protein